MADRVHPDSEKKGKLPEGSLSKGAYDSLHKKESKDEVTNVDTFGQGYADRPAPASSAYIPQSFIQDGGYNGRPVDKVRRRKRACCLCMAWFCGAVILILFLLGLAVLIFWLVVRPKAPQFSVDQIRLTRFSVDVAQSGFVINAATTYAVNVRNPNKRMGIYYDHIKIDVTAVNSTIAHGTVPSFYQGHKNTTTIRGEVRADAYPVDSTVATVLQQAQTSGRIPLKVDVHLKVRIKLGSWKSPRVKVGVHCDVDINPDVSASTQVVQNSQKCKFKI